MVIVLRVIFYDNVKTGQQFNFEFNWELPVK